MKEVAISKIIVISVLVTLLLITACGPDNANVRLQNQGTRTEIILYLDQNNGSYQYTIYAGPASAPGEQGETIEIVAEGTYEWIADRESPGGIVGQGTIEIANDKRSLYQDVGLERFEWFDE